ncbi:hypothetical protein D6833_08030 [Candidatus Parcubacteria bacterium]|nr:MAG: hypothetical protein D6833_08030 [Candidatus Parcubacteria bacterium]
MTEIPQINTREELRRFKDEKFPELKGKTTWINKAARDYGIPAPTVLNWMREGLVRRLGTSGRRVLLDAQDVAYCAYIYKIYERHGTQGRRMFNKDGTPRMPATGPFSQEAPASSS